MRYIHLNPLKAKIVRNLDELKAYPWTGHKALIEDIPLSWYDHGSVLSLFGKDMQEARKNYLQFLRDGFQEDVDFEGGGLMRSKGHGKGMIITGKISDYQLFDERILGDNEFIKGIYSAGAIDDNEDESNQKEKMTIEEIIDSIAAKHNISRDALLKKNVNRTATKVRPIIAYLGVNKLGLTNTKVSKILNVSNSNICKMLMKNKKSFEAYGQMSIGEIIGK